MTPQANFTMLAWMPVVVLGFFRFLPPRRAVIVSFIGAWLFLPQRVSFEFLGLPDYDRMSATCYSIFLATVVYDAQRFRSFKVTWLDVPMIVWCFLGPFSTALVNGLGAYEGASAVLDRVVAYGLPYFFGRVYLNDWIGQRQMAISMFVSGLIYAPLCVLEVIISPQLHRMVYGYHGINQFSQGMRLGGFRPTVFMRHGLSVGMWMMAATLIGLWLWQSGVLKSLWAIPMAVLIAGMIVTVVLVKSTGAYAYLIYGVLVLFVAKWFRTSLPLLVLIVLLSGYLGLAASGNFSGESKDRIVSISADIAGEERSQSLQFRLDNEEVLGEKAREQPIFGWGRWGRNRVYDYDWSGELVDTVVTDSMWIQAFGVNGIIGLISIVAVQFTPALVFMVRYPAHTWFTPLVAPAAALNVVIVLYMLDCTLNNQVNPVYSVVSGGIIGLLVQRAPAVSRTPGASHSMIKPSIKSSTNLTKVSARLARKRRLNRALPAGAPRLHDS
ncbi:MAG: O-antigen ligase domain-containing protein [Oscillatoriales cyanobacterium RM2_1_1]|nr:O-antigen ligase domain-containing protein [Oscillatoriales cyanobacterium SM2_3_0]NJO46415.1 O-antigen ligase domain-containing protein [Oscillatoriales cyanobacterium RM2_1_1]